MVGQIELTHQINHVAGHMKDDMFNHVAGHMEGDMFNLIL